MWNYFPFLTLTGRTGVSLAVVNSVDPATRAANSFKTFWLQSFAMVQARTQANSIDVWVRKSTPLVGYVHEG